MNFKSYFNKISYLTALSSVSLGFLSACGPGAAQFELLPTSQNAFQGSVANNKVDILWVIDNSGSMAPKQTTLSNGFNSFINIFDTKSFDYRMAVVTTDTRATPTGQAGIFQGATKVLTTSTAGLAAAFTTNVSVGNLGSAQAKAIDATSLALSTSLLNTDNTGFLRSDAHLAVIYVSDADDNDSTSSTSDLVSFLDTLKPQKYDVIARTYKRNYTISAVVAPSASDADCDANYGAMTYERGTKFITLASQTNGSTASICSASFATGLTNLSQRIAEAITEIPLSRAPNTSTISVTFNGVAVANDATNGWTYDSTNQKIVFHGTSIPTENTVIAINYTPNDIVR